ncbi:MAG TPA: HIT domain-containing protein [Pseudonocardiaceae bacterium]|nr:HIT domain-containing protein [Pseudonocardiaceae bacterium]
MQVLVDADNLDVPRLRLLVAALEAAASADVVVAGAPAALEAIDWPAHARVLPAAGWQGADLLLAHAYRAEDRPLLLATGDGDFAQLVRRHPGPVLLVGSTSNRSRALAAPHITPTDPALDGGAQLRAWIATRSQRAERRIVSTLFSRIIAGEIPGRFVWRDERCVAFLTIAPLRPGHALVVPRHEVDEWTDADDDLLAHLLAVARQIGAAQKIGFGAPRAGLVIAGFEVPHLHLHAFPTWDINDFDFANADRDPDPAELDAAADTLRQALRQAGHGDQVPS